MGAHYGMQQNKKITSHSKKQKKKKFQYNQGKGPKKKIEKIDKDLPKT